MSNSGTFTVVHGTSPGVFPGYVPTTWDVLYVNIPSAGRWTVDFYITGRLLNNLPGQYYGWCAGPTMFSTPIVAVGFDSQGNPIMKSIFSLPLTFDKNGNALTFAPVTATLSYLDVGGNVTSSTTVAVPA